MRNTIDIADMAEDKKKSIKGFLKSVFGKNKAKETKEKEEIADNKQEIVRHIPKKIEVETLLKNFEKLHLQKTNESAKKEEEDELKNFSYKTFDDDELGNFTYKVVEEDRRTERTESHSSQDSGFSEKDTDDKSENLDDVITNSLDETDKQSKSCEHETKHSKSLVEKSKSGENETNKHDDESTREETTKPNDTPVKEAETTNGARTEELIDSLQGLKLDDGKKKKSQLVPVSRAPIRNKVGDISGTYHPYGNDLNSLLGSGIETQINHTVNKHTFSGGQVIVANRLQEFSEVEVNFDKTTEELQNFSNGLAQRGVQFDQTYDLDLVQEYLDEENNTTDSNILKEFLNENCEDTVQAITNILQEHVEKEMTENPIEELEQTNHLNYDTIDNLDTLIGLQEDKFYTNVDVTNIYPTPPRTEAVYSPNQEFYANLLTPPRSETIPSPMSESSAYPTNSDYTLSPNSDCEKYQDIPQFYEEFPNELPTVIDDDTDKKARERKTSASLLSMKNFKDLQKEQAAVFVKMECCKVERKPCKEIFLGHLKKLKAEDRKNLCFRVSSMDVKTCYGVLHHILIGLSRGAVDEDLHLSLFALLCEKILGTQPELFLEDFGLDLLKAAALRCPQRPLLTRNVVECIHSAAKIRPDLHEGKEFLFDEIDARGDTLVTACARAGDRYSGVLAEIARAASHKPLIDARRANTEGHTALHVACREHSAASPHLHTAHVLLEHAGADIWKGDAKGGDSAVHAAVNAASCDLRLVLLLFHHLDRKLWKKLAHLHNRSSVTPLDYARCAAKSSTRQNYPTEVLDFLKKCR